MEPEGETRWEFTIPGRPTPKDRARTAPGRRRPHSTKRSDDYEARVAWLAIEAGVRLGAGPASVHIRFWSPNMRSLPDGDNVLKAVLDGLVKGGAKVLKDDNVKVVVDKRATWMGVDKTNPRVEVVARLVEGGEAAL